MKQETVRHNVRLEWGLSETAWQEGEALLAAGLFRGAVARYYYSVFHGARAVLLSRDLEPSTPTGVRVAYTRTFVRPGVLPRETARILGALQQERQDADYTRDFDVDRGDAEEARHDASAFRDIVSFRLRADALLE